MLTSEPRRSSHCELGGCLWARVLPDGRVGVCDEAGRELRVPVDAWRRFLGVLKMGLD